MVGGDNGVFYTVGNHEEAVMTIEQRLERLERRANRYRNAADIDELVDLIENSLRDALSEI